MKNRYGDEYDFIEVRPNTYKIVGELSYWRFGGQEYAENIDTQNLGFVDPAGGPFITGGYKIKERKVIRIFTEGDDILFDVE